jgi:O-antigen/teichoic acid export membrane protein
MADLRRSLVINFVSTTGMTAMQFVVSVLLARMLSPREIGVFSMTVVFINIAHNFRDFGVSTYLQREPELNTEKLRAATGVLFTTSWSIALLLFFASGWIATWFNEPKMAPVMRVLSIGFLFIPFGSITGALLTREYAAGKQAIANIVGTIVFSGTCLGLAVLGFGTMSMAWANLANIVASALAFVPFRPKYLPWLPSFKKWRDVFHFGAGTLIANCLTSINNALPDIMLGKLGSATHVGLFSRASSTVSIFTYVAGSTVNYGSLSYLSQAHHRGESIGPLLNRATALLTGIGWPVLALTMVLDREIILALYGEKWLPAVPAIPALCLAAAVTMIFNYTPTALTALGRPYFSAIPTAVIVGARIAFAFALFDGRIMTFSWAIFGATVAATPVLIYQHYRQLNHRFLTMFRALVPSALVSLACMVAAELMKITLPSEMTPVATLMVMALPLAGVWYVALRLSRHPIIGEVHHLVSGIKARFA